jgi:hypothetical protein
MPAATALGGQAPLFGRDQAAAASMHHQQHRACALPSCLRPAVVTPQALPERINLGVNRFEALGFENLPVVRQVPRFPRKQHAGRVFRSSH